MSTRSIWTHPTSLLGKRKQQSMFGPFRKVEKLSNRAYSA